MTWLLLKPLLKTFGPWAAGVLLIIGLFAAYHHQISAAEDRGHAQAKAEYDQRIGKYEQAVEKQNRDAEAARLQLIADQKLVLAELSEKLKTAQKRKIEVQTLIKEVPRYVTVQADSHCVVPAGAVWLLDRAIASESTPGDPGLSSGVPRDVDSPSGVALSQLVSIESDNLSECVLRGEVISAWQDWYAQNLRLWTELQAKQKPAPTLK